MLSTRGARLACEIKSAECTFRALKWRTQTEEIKAGRIAAGVLGASHWPWAQRNVSFLA